MTRFECDLNPRNGTLITVSRIGMGQVEQKVEQGSSKQDDLFSFSRKRSASLTFL